jgi:membrane-bound metal-dependent hydrolase YbcI (DUF457 family)
MDSLTQLTFGAACGEAVLGQKVGRRALVWGAILGTLPDLDVFIPLGGPVDDFVYHRELQPLADPAGALFTADRLADHESSPGHEAVLSRMGSALLSLYLEASVLLDLLTIYGTQILWPFDTTPLAFPVLFIIDPLFTLPILAGVLGGADANRGSVNPGVMVINSVGLFLSLVYLAWAFGAGELVEGRVRERLARQQVSYTQFISSPAPFSLRCSGGSWASRKTAISRPTSSLFDRNTPLLRRFLPQKPGLDDRNRRSPSGRQTEMVHPRILCVFCCGRGCRHDSICAWGRNPIMFSEFKVARLDDRHPQPIDDQRLKTTQDWRGLDLGMEKNLEPQAPNVKISDLHMPKNAFREFWIVR